MRRTAVRLGGRGNRAVEVETRGSKPGGRNLGRNVGVCFRGFGQLPAGGRCRSDVEGTDNQSVWIPRMDSTHSDKPSRRRRRRYAVRTAFRSVSVCIVWLPVSDRHLPDTPPRKTLKAESKPPFRGDFLVAIPGSSRWGSSPGCFITWSLAMTRLLLFGLLTMECLSTAAWHRIAGLAFEDRMRMVLRRITPVCRRRGRPRTM